MGFSVRGIAALAAGAIWMMGCGVGAAGFATPEDGGGESTKDAGRLSGDTAAQGIAEASVSDGSVGSDEAPGNDAEGDPDTSADGGACGAACADATEDGRPETEAGEDDAPPADAGAEDATDATAQDAGAPPADAGGLQADAQVTGDGSSETDGGNDAALPLDAAAEGAAAGDGATQEAGGLQADSGSTTAPRDAATMTAFGYAPSNFTASQYAGDVPGAGTTVNCDMTYVSPGAAGASTWCGAAGPYVVPNVAQSAGPDVDILVFSGLTIGSGFTLTLTGTNPVIFAVYGDATISGTINASADGATPGAGGNKATYCGTAAQDSQNLQFGGGGGGGRAVAGGNGDQGGGFTNQDDTGGAASGSSAATPLVGGCSGEIGGNQSSNGLNDGNCQVCQQNGNNCEPPGAGGGGVQISAAGVVDVTGTIETNGGAGTSGGTTPNGGGGGGSAGDILLEGTTVVQDGTLSANGGAGGVGGSNGNTGGPAGAGGTNNGTSQAEPESGGGGSGTLQGGGGGGGSYGYVVILEE